VELTTSNDGRRQGKETKGDWNFGMAKEVRMTMQRTTEPRTFFLCNLFLGVPVGAGRV
jgi:hypothetical protein